MPTDCIFCAIAQGRRPASRVWENDRVLAFMDQRQAQPGHVLVIPKRHCPDIYTLPADTSGDLMQALVRLSNAVRDALRPDGINLWQSNGKAAGQEVFHLHFHIHPRRYNDGLASFYSTKPPTPPANELDRLAAQICDKLPPS